MKDKLIDFYEDYCERAIKAPALPFVLGVINLVVAENFAGVTLGTILVLTAVVELLESK